MIKLLSTSLFKKKEIISIFIYYFLVIVPRKSASFQYNCAKNGKGLKIGTKKADTT